MKIISSILITLIECLRFVDQACLINIIIFKKYPLIDAGKCCILFCSIYTVSNYHLEYYQQLLYIYHCYQHSSWLAIMYITMAYVICTWYFCPTSFRFVFLNQRIQVSSCFVCFQSNNFVVFKLVPYLATFIHQMIIKI